VVLAVLSDRGRGMAMASPPVVNRARIVDSRRRTPSSSSSVSSSWRLRILRRNSFRYAAISKDSSSRRVASSIAVTWRVAVGAATAEVAVTVAAAATAAVTAVAAALTRARTAEVNAGDAAASTELAEATLMAASARGSTLAQQLSVANSAVAAAAAAAVEQEATVAAHKRRADAASDAVTKLEVELGYIEVAAEGGSDRGCGSGWLRGGLADDHAHVTNTANAAPAASQSARLTFHSVPAAAMVARAQLSVARAQVLHLKEYATVWTASIDPPSTAAPVTRP